MATTQTSATYEGVVDHTYGFLSVAVDEVVAAEYAKVRRLYSRLKIPERTDIEFFDGVHEIHSQGTFRFLQKHLHGPPSR